MPFIHVFLEDELHQALKEVAKAQKRPMYWTVPHLLAEGVVKWEQYPPNEEKPKTNGHTDDEIDFGVKSADSGQSGSAPKPGSVKSPRKG